MLTCPQKPQCSPVPGSLCACLSLGASVLTCPWEPLCSPVWKLQVLAAGPPETEEGGGREWTLQGGPVIYALTPERRVVSALCR